MTIMPISRIKIDQYKNAGLSAIVEQLRFCEYKSNVGGLLENNVAFIALEELARESE